MVPTQQSGVKYILETLEPEALDSFFNWNFFDAMLGQKEYYSAYIFEDTATDLMKNDTALRTAFEAKKKIDKDFAKDGKAQLDWVYENSPYYEKKLTDSIQFTGYYKFYFIKIASCCFLKISGSTEVSNSLEIAYPNRIRIFVLKLP